LRIAILDLGTNTFHCLVVKVRRNGTFERLFKSKTVVKLGEGIHQGLIIPVAFQRGLRTIKHYKTVLKKFKPDQVFAFATSAARSAVNGTDFIEAIREKTGIDVQIISGDREAELIYKGVQNCVTLDDQPVLIMDIGGGSTEFIIANNKKIFWKESFDLGASRLLQMFTPSDPISPAEILSVKSYLEKVLKPLFVQLKKHVPIKLIGSSGSFDTLAEMAGHMFQGRNVIKGVTSYEFNLEEYYKLHQVLLPSTIAERRKMKGLIKLRIDLIVIASIFTEFILNKSGIRKMTLSKYALKEGALFEVIENSN
jgi:exopolyphosphatase / guanosine-5'-triphosphate,3'-diphosphate pyrophosphatase